MKNKGKMNIKALGDLCDIISGGTPSRSKAEYWNGGTIPWIKIGNIKNKYVNEADEFISQEGLDNSSAKILSKGTILYTIFATLGEVGILTFEACTNQAIAGITIKNSSDLLTDYLYYYLKSKKEYVNNLGRGVAQNNINLTILRRFEVPLPDIQVQYQVISVLDKVANNIASYQQELQKLDELVKARFVELFGDPNVNDKNWPLGKINDIGKCVAGATPSTAKKEYWENGTIPWLSSGEVNKGRIFETDTKITQLGYDNASTKMVPARTVVLAMAGQGKTRGTAAITEIELCTNQSICSIVNNNRMNPEYLLQFLKLQYQELRNASTSAEGRGGLNLKIIGGYPIMIPPIEIQNEFADFVAQVDKVKFAVQESLNKTQLLFDSLMQQYFG